MADYFELDFFGVETKKSGDAIAIRYEVDGSTYIHVIDGGYITTGENLRDHIIRYYGNPDFIDHVVATHNDGDHARGLIAVLEHFEVGALWMLRPWMYAAELIDLFPTYTSVDRLRSALRVAYSNLAALEDIAERRGIPIYEPFQGAQIGAFHVMAPTRNRYLDLILTSNKTPESLAEEPVAEGFFKGLVDAAKSAVAYIQAAWGGEAFPAEDTSNENEMSVVQFAYLNGKKILLTADTGRDGLQEVIDYAPLIGLSLPGIDKFQVPHHGGRRNVNSELLDAIVGVRLPAQVPKGIFEAYISSAKADEDHPRKVVERALIHRGADLHETEGRNIRTCGGFRSHARGLDGLSTHTIPRLLREGVAMALPISTDIAQMFDSYGRQARLFPGLLTIFPPLLAVLAWFPWFLLSNVAATLLTVAMSCGLLYALGSYARTKGKRLEPKLLAHWGGWPTTQLLRHDSDLDQHTRLRYHEYLAQAVPGKLPFPTAEQEKADRRAANAVYDSAIRWLKEKARGKEFVMVHRENAQYGFRRNLRGLKPFAIVICALTMAALAAAVAFTHPGAVEMMKAQNWSALGGIAADLSPAVLAAFTINVFAILIWTFVVTKEWVREAAFQYATALLAACDQIGLQKEVS